ncbi:MAG TPA: hypothetical protein VN137_02205 [Sphingomonas sp.]|nr:hypothetical protein [Sphingomonas sp.]
MGKALSAAAVALACAATSGQAKSGQQTSRTSGYAVEISGVVPVICHAETDVAVVPPGPGEVSLGTLKEFCNNPNGYEVYADYAPALAKASLSIDGHKVPLDASGSTRIDRSNGARAVTRNLSLNLPESVPSATIAFRILPLQR